MHTDGFSRLLDIGGETLLIQIITLFLSTVPPKVEACSQFLAERELVKLQQHAHAIKSSAANLGLRELQSRALELEDAAEIQDILTCRATLAEIRNLFPEIVENLEHKLAELEDINVSESSRD